MKKMMILALVVGMASLASAGLSLDVQASVNAGDSFDVTIVSDSVNQYDAYLLMADTGTGAYSLAAAIGGASNVSDASLVYFGTAAMPGVDAYQAVNSNPTEGDLVAGPGFTFTVIATGLAGQTIDFQLMDQTFAQVDAASVAITPEPMTMALLGLGGLFLRRRK